MARKSRNGRKMNSLFITSQESFINAHRCICGHTRSSHGEDYCAISTCDGECKDKGFDAYWAGDRAKFENIPEYDYNLIENFIDLGWTRKLDE